MAIFSYIVFYGLFIFIQANVSEGVECYQCSHVNGTGSPDCIEPFPNPVPLTNITVVECEKYCIKSVTMETVSNPTGGTAKEFYASSRTCGSQCIEACYRAAPGRARETCTYCCEGELCNTANTVSQSLALLPILLTFVLKLF
ncbi:U-scoloptoxin(05)-Cw1a-like [Lytechinus variegatus]|uniref:U-scoloptoxin(05)-Cw1a-like n=1 Tax=Lytechinus variegatus TaxID=7654 RepID=UPI001BB15F0C|nr:U-scoloptoxin(05)-Cw1a-like [Lytechinus variegatus]